jgi:putative RecB family exonuclease
MAVEIPSTLSPSKLGKFMSCPLAFRYSYIDHIPEPATQAQLRGTLVHRALQILYAEGGALDRTPKHALNALDVAYLEMIETDEMLGLGLDDAGTDAFIQEARALITHYFMMEDPVSVEPIGIELDLRAMLGDVELRGIIDRLDRLPNGDIVVTDYKTGRSPRPEQSRGRLIGVQFYAYLCQEAFGLRPSEVRLLYLKDQVVIVESPNDQTMRGLTSRALAVWAAIERACETEDFRPNVTALCKFCSYQDLCPAFQASTSLRLSHSSLKSD